MQKSKFQFTILSLVICSGLHSYLAYGDDYFDPSLIEGNATNPNSIDLSVFNKKGGQAAGVYQVEVYVNNSYIDTKKIRFENEGSKLVPVFTKEDYIHLGVLGSATPAFMKLEQDKVISNIGSYIPQADTNFDFEQQRLNISIPQDYINASAQGYIPSSEWDDGINALFVNYNYSGSSTKNDYKSGVETNSYVNLRSGVNIGAWRLRNYSTYSHSNHDSQWKSLNTYVQRDIKSLKSQLIIGETYTPSDVFDSFSFRGIQMYSDDGMLPSSLRGFAPIVRGIAQTNAQVTIRQNGNIIWQSYVPPGPFAIRDLYPTSSSGDLDVTIKEADGTTRQFVQAFSAVPIMQREGRLKYSLAVGEYRSTYKGEKEPNFIQATSIYGLPYTSTVYNGTILSKNYNSFLLGIGKSLGSFGSVSLDTTFANAKMHGDETSGASIRFQYAKDITQTGTTFTLAGYRYSTSGYRDFNEANGYYNNQTYTNYAEDNADTAIKYYNDWRSGLNKRSKIQLNVNQSLAGYGSVYLSGYQQQYWNNKGKEQSINFGYNNSYKGINYSVNYTLSKDLYQNRRDQMFSFSVQFPLDFIRPNTWLNIASSSDDKGNNTSTVGVSGTALADNNLNYNVQQGYTNRGTGATGSAMVDYKGSHGEYQLGYNYTRHTQQVNYGAMGGIVAHSEGVNFTQPLGDTIAIVKAKDASNLRVENNTGIYTDKKGYAVVPYITPYQRNRISLDSSTLGSNVDLLSNTKFVVPSNGAVVMANFATLSGHKVFMTLTGSVIPFGAKATVDSDGMISKGIVDDKQQVYLSGVQSTGTLNVSWNNGACKAPFKIPETNKDIVSLSVDCK